MKPLSSAGCALDFSDLGASSICHCDFVRSRGRAGLTAFTVTGFVDDFAEHFNSVGKMFRLEFLDSVTRPILADEALAND